MKILGIESSTDVCSVGLVDDNGYASERSVVQSHIHSEKLLTLIDEILNAAHTTVSELSAVAVSIGPGSFSGLRIGLSTAKGLCYAHTIPLLSVPTLASMAWTALEEHAEWNAVIIALDARQGEFYTGRFMRTSDRTIEVPVQVRSREELVHHLQPGDVLLTDAPEALEMNAGERRRVFRAREFTSGEMIATLGLDLLKRGGTSDLGHTEPMYLKDFVARTVPKG